MFILSLSYVCLFLCFVFYGLFALFFIVGKNKLQ
jgi:hypothetical protein